MLPLVAEIGKPRDIQAWNADGELTTMSSPQSGRSLSRMRGKDGEEPGLGDSRPFTKGVARRKGSARGHGSNLPIAKRFRWREKLSADAWAPRHERVFFSSPLPAIRALICIHIRRLILIWSSRSSVPQVGLPGAASQDYRVGKSTHMVDTTHRCGRSNAVITGLPRSATFSIAEMFMQQKTVFIGFLSINRATKDVYLSLDLGI